MLKKPFHYFLVGSFLVFLFFVILLASLDKDEAFFFIHKQRLGLLDAAMPYLTHLGDGLVFCLLFPILYSTNKKAGIHLLISGIFVLVLVQVLKLLVFQDALRPFGMLPHERLYLLEGIDMHTSNGFPSGHTASAFVLFGVLAFYLKKPRHQLLLLLLASIAAWSRIYLGQHFVGDVGAGLFIGLVGVWVGKIAVGKLK
ncbi:MAG: phosphatase PAP2 family protein [Flavobacteriaceae bacterium]|nr:phosphatase PAP2 family protein [Flavobacteriaceae bacterium]